MSGQVDHPVSAQGAWEVRVSCPGTGALSPEAHNQSVMMRNARVWELTASEFGTHGPSILLESGSPKALSQSMMGPPEPPRRQTEERVRWGGRDHAQLDTGAEEQLQNPPHSSHKSWPWPKGL